MVCGAEWESLKRHSERICLCRLHTHYNLGGHIRSLSPYTKLPLIMDTALWLFSFLFPSPPALPLKESTPLSLSPSSLPPSCPVLPFSPFPPLFQLGDCSPGAMAGVHTSSWRWPHSLQHPNSHHQADTSTCLQKNIVE